MQSADRFHFLASSLLFRLSLSISFFSPRVFCIKRQEMPSALNATHIKWAIIDFYWSLRFRKLRAYEIRDYFRFLCEFLKFREVFFLVLVCRRGTSRVAINRFRCLSSAANKKVSIYRSAIKTGSQLKGPKCLTAWIVWHELENTITEALGRRFLQLKIEFCFQQENSIEFI